MKLLLLLFWFSSGPELEQVRTLFLKAGDRSATLELYKAASEKSNESYLYMSYQGAAQMMMARYADHPYNKLLLFIRGKEMLEQAIQDHPSDPELRYLRLIIQKNAPRILGYNESIESDALLLASHVNLIGDVQLKKMIIDLLTNQP